MCKSLLLSIVVSLIGCQYQGLEDPDMYLSHDLERVCTPTISLRAKALKNNQGNREKNQERCLVKIGTEMMSSAEKLTVEWVGKLTADDIFGSCQYLIPFDGGTQQSCKGGNHYITFKTSASWESNDKESFSGAALRMFVTGIDGKIVGSQSVNLTNATQKSVCIELSLGQSDALGSIVASIVLVARDGRKPSISISDALLTSSAPDGGMCDPLDPL